MARHNIVVLAPSGYEVSNFRWMVCRLTRIGKSRINLSKLSGGRVIFGYNSLIFSLLFYQLIKFCFLFLLIQSTILRSPDIRETRENESSCPPPTLGVTLILSLTLVDVKQ